ncbi:MAG: NAD(P)/FAD-dependent oxidoreductase [Pelosinus sp.]|nr:NAD(P)/FAD-dependent oxidoreductase [Pelosinus sp.]
MDVKRDLLDKGAILQRDKETYAIVPHIPGGIILEPGMLRKIADVAEKYNAKALKLTTAQRIAIVGIKEEDIEKAWQDLGMDTGAAAGLCVRSVKICPATHFCKRAQQDAVSLGLEIDKRYHGLALPSKFKIAVSGCMNSCTEPAVKDLGIVGTPRGYNVMIGGNAGVMPRIADVLVKDITSAEVLVVIDKIIKYYKEHARSHERLGRMMERLGVDKVIKDLG